MERKGIVNGVNQAGMVQRVAVDEVRIRARRKPSSFEVCMLSILNAFGSFVSPIKETKKGK